MCNHRSLVNLKVSVRFAGFPVSLAHYNQIKPMSDETFLNEKIPSALVNINSYNLERKDREAVGGGVGVYVKKTLLTACVGMT